LQAPSAGLPQIPGQQVEYRALGLVVSGADEAEAHLGGQLSIVVLHLAGDHGVRDGRRRGDHVATRAGDQGHPSDALLRIADGGASPRAQLPLHVARQRVQPHLRNLAEHPDPIHRTRGRHAAHSHPKTRAMGGLHEAARHRRRQG